MYDDVIRSEKDGCASHDFSLLTLRLRQNKTFNAKYGEKFEATLADASSSIFSPQWTLFATCLWRPRDSLCGQAGEIQRGEQAGVAVPAP